MSAKPQIGIPTPGSRITYEEFLNLPEDRYELNNGELLLTPAPTAWHNLILDRIAQRLRQFTSAHQLGAVFTETDFRLGADLVLRPDVAYLDAKLLLPTLDLKRSPIQVAPQLAIEVASPSNSFQDMMRKVQQYGKGGCRAVWIVIPESVEIQVYNITTRSIRTVRSVVSPEPLIETLPFDQEFTLSLEEVFEPNVMKS